MEEEAQRSTEGAARPRALLRVLAPGAPQCIAQLAQELGRPHGVGRNARLAQPVEDAEGRRGDVGGLVDANERETRSPDASNVGQRVDAS